MEVCLLQSLLLCFLEALQALLLLEFPQSVQWACLQWGRWVLEGLALEALDFKVQEDIRFSQALLVFLPW